MKIIIVGAGSVGYVAAETLCDTHDVLVIESDADVADTVRTRLNVSVLHEDGTNPKTIRTAVETHRAEVIISTLNRDDSNLFISMISKRLFPNIITVASVTNPDYIIDTSSEGVPGVDVIISPELLTAAKMHKLCTLENAVDYEPMSIIDASMAVFSVSPDSPLIGSVVMNTFPFRRSAVFAIYRSGELNFQVDTMEIHAGDLICLMGDEGSIAGFNDDLGVQQTSRDIVILGGTIVGRHLARLLAADDKKRYIRIIEKKQDLCRELSRTINGVVIVNGDFTEPELQSSENIFRADCLVSVTNQDDTNLLMCMSAQKSNTNKVVSRYLKKEYQDIFTFTGLETIIGFDRIVSNEVAKCVASESRVILRMREKQEVLLMYDIDDSSKLCGRYFGDVILPSGVRIVALRRGDRTIYPLMDTKFENGDKAIIFTNLTKDKDLAKVFGRGFAAEI